MNLLQKLYFIGLKSEKCLIFICRRLKPTAKKHPKTPDMLFEMLPLIIFTIFLSINLNLPAQEKPSITLQQAISLAVENNHLLKIRDYQIDEKQAKVAESRIKALPSIIANSTWQYNQNLGNLTIEQGEFGVLPLSQQMIIPLPASQLNFPLSKHNTFNAGVTFYQPLTQLAKIKVGVDVSKTEFLISEEEKEKSILQISQAVEKLYYGLLITGKQIEEAEAKYGLSDMKLKDAESALKSGKIIETNIAGLKAGKADEEQNLIKLRFQEEDFLADFSVLTGLSPGRFSIEPVDLTASADSVNVFPDDLNHVNCDMKLARLTQTKAEQAIKAAQWTYLPDIGIIAGYTYQKGNKIFPEQNPFVGATAKWNLQDLLLNRQLVNQRRSQFLQSQEQTALIEKQVNADLEKTMRKLSHAKALIATAREVVIYRNEELRTEQDKAKNGLNTPSSVLNAKAFLAKAEAAYFSSCLNYRMVMTEMEMLY
jgi:outer membrane protein